MRILFLGYVVSEDEANRLSGASVAGNTMQLELLRQLRNVPSLHVDVCSVLPVATFPKEPRRRIRGRHVEVAPGIPVAAPGFITLPGLKQPSQILGLANTAMKFARSGNYDYVFTYNSFPHVGVPAWAVSRRFGVPVVSLLADPPVDPAYSPRTIRSLAERAFNLWTRQLLGSVDRVVALTASAAEEFAPQAPALIIDGAVPVSQITDVPLGYSSSGEKIILYTGALTAYNGLSEMIGAMRLVKDPDVVLHVYGSGPLRQSIEEAACGNSNVRFMGQVHSDQIPALQRSAFLLINPRQIDHPLSDVTFPSKVLQYMASGTPVLTTRLRCFTREYESLLYFAEKGSSEDLAESIDRLAALPVSEMAYMGRTAADFVRDNRTWHAAAGRIVQFLEDR